MTQRTFIPGSPWLFFKLYTGHKTADELLTDVLYPFVRDLQTLQLIDSWFFIRYTDPDFHIRFRLHIPDAASYSAVMTAFHSWLQPCMEDGSLSKVLCDTYNRELERYGEATIGSIEELFCIDSTAQIELLARLAEEPEARRETLRQHLSLLLLDDALTAFGYDLAAKLRLTEQMADSFKREFGFTTHAYTKQLNDKYRAARSDIEQVMATRKDCAAFEDILSRRRRKFGEIAHRTAGIADSEVADPTPAIPDDLLRSIQHMTMNRWFRSRNRQHELVIYDFLSKYFKSAQARTRPTSDSESHENRKKSRENQGEVVEW